MEGSLQTAADDHLLSGTFGLSLLPTSARFLSSFPPSFLGGSDRKVHSMSLESAGRWPCPGADGGMSKKQPLTLGHGGSRSVQRPSQRLRPPWAGCALSSLAVCCAFTPLASCVPAPPWPGGDEGRVCLLFWGAGQHMPESKPHPSVSLSGSQWRWHPWILSAQ